MKAKKQIKKIFSKYENGGNTSNIPPYKRMDNKLDVPEQTKLTIGQEIAFNNWAKRVGINPELEGQDYDLRGYFKQYGANPLDVERLRKYRNTNEVNKEGEWLGHGTDKFKTFNPYGGDEYSTLSDESKYASGFDKRGQSFWTNEKGINDYNVERKEGDWKLVKYKKGGKITSKKKKK